MKKQIGGIFQETICQFDWNREGIEKPTLYHLASTHVLSLTGSFRKDLRVSAGIQDTLLVACGEYTQGDQKGTLLENLYI